MRPVLVLRPEPGNTTTCTAARALGLTPHPAPLFTYTPIDWTLSSPSPSGQGSGWGRAPSSQLTEEPPNHIQMAGEKGTRRTPYQGLLIGSAAVFTHAGPQLTQLRQVPVHAVGPTTARAAQTAGFQIAQTGIGGLQTLVNTLPPGRYLRLSGEAKVPLTPPPGVTIDDVTVYAAQPQPLAPDTIALIRHTAVLALLHSGEAARHFAAQCTAHNLPRSQIALACLAPRIAETAGTDWQAVACAPRPDDNAVLSLAQQMCQIV